MIKALKITALSLTLSALVLMSFNHETESIHKVKAYSDSLNLAPHKGKIVVLNFWASWSKLSRTENKNIVRIFDKYRNHPRLSFISVSLDTDEKSWKAAIEADEMAWTDHVCDYKKYSSPIASAYNVKTIPNIFILDKQGNVIKSSSKVSDLEADIENLIK